MPEPKPKPRVRGGKRQRCSRTGCPNNRQHGYGYCRRTCQDVARLLEEAQRVTEVTGDSAHWAAAVAASDALSAYYASDRSIYRAARESGFTPEQWAAVKQPGRTGS